METLEWGGAQIPGEVQVAYRADDIKLLPKKQHTKLKEWSQVPVLGFNCRCYDLNLIKEDFAERLADATTIVRVVKNGSKIMFLLTPGFCFLGVINYIGPGTRCEKWVKAIGCAVKKSWLPYECSTAWKRLTIQGCQITRPSSSA